MADDRPEAKTDPNADLKAKMREALDRKKGKSPGAADDAPIKEKTHGPEVTGSNAHGGAGGVGHRRKAGGGGS